MILSRSDQRQLARIPASPVQIANGLAVARLASGGTGAAQQAIDSVLEAMGQSTAQVDPGEDVYDPHWSSTPLATPALPIFRASPRPCTSGRSFQCTALPGNAALFFAMRNYPALFGMGTTNAAAMLRREDALCFNVGDSRIYRMGNWLTRISEDHVIAGNMLTRCIGGIQEHITPEPFVMRVLWKAGQRLLLCSDGLTDMVTDEEIAAILASEVVSPADALLAAALAAGGVDNVTAVVIERLD